MGWIDRISRRIRRGRSRDLGGTWVVAVSGGGDSVGLLRVLHELAPTAGLSLSVAHLDHGVRGEASRADAAFVADLAATLGLPFDLGHWRPILSGHFESEARCARYAWLTQIARARNADVVAVGHTRDDQAETILHRIVRGTGPRGLVGIPRQRALATDPPILLVRPLLSAYRHEIRAYLTGIGQDCREDASNADLTRTRARIRHDLLPRLADEYNPKVVDALVRLGELAAASQRAIEADAARWSKRRSSLSPKIVRFYSMPSSGRFLPSTGPRSCGGSGDAPDGPKRACRRSDGVGWRVWSGRGRSPASRSGPECP